jgi:hypothetical protein
MDTCTWADCTNPAIKKQVAEDGEVWANLCNEHAFQMDQSLNEIATNPAKMLGAWVKAQGGSKKAAGRMMRTFPGS